MSGFNFKKNKKNKKKKSSVLFPAEYYKNAYAINYRKLFADGIRGLIFDIDNTVVGDNAPADERSRKFAHELHGIGFSVLFLSNNDEERVKSFSDRMAYSQYICNAAKPSKHGYIKAMKMMGTDRDSTVMIGDQIFTDIWGANRAGVRSILVGKLYRKERVHIYFKRVAEKVVKLMYWMSGGRRLEGG